MAQRGVSGNGGRDVAELGQSADQREKSTVQSEGETSNGNQRKSTETENEEARVDRDRQTEDGNSEEQRKGREDHIGRISSNGGNDLSQMLKGLQEAIVGAIQHRSQTVAQPAPVTPILPIVTAMKNLKTSHFEGSPDPIEAIQWFRKLERNLETSMCPENLKKRIGVYYLDKDAAEWWDSRENYLPQPISWTTFKREFEKKYFTPEAKIRLQRQFLNLQQGDRTVREYESEFMRLRRYALSGQDSEEALITHFLFGVRPELESRLAVGTYTSLTEVIEKAANVEIGVNAEKALREKLGSPSSKGKAPTEDSPNERTKFSGACNHCGKIGHKAKDCRSKKREERSTDVTCYICHQKGHISRYCPAQRPIPATPLATRPAHAPLAIEPAPKRQAIGGRVYALEVGEPETVRPAQGPNAGNGCFV